MEKIEFYYEMVDKVIRDLGVDPSLCRTQQAGQWDLKKGSASVWVDVFLNETKDYGYVQIMSPIMEFPVQNRDLFMTEVLEINHGLYAVGFTKHKEWLYIKAIRELEDLSEAELVAMFNRVGNYSDKYDDYLKEKYNPGGGNRS